MPFATKLRQRLTARQQVERARYEAHQEWQNRKWLRDELSDQAERLAAPMETPPFIFRLGKNGLQSDLGESLTKVQQDGITEAERQAAHNPDWKIELQRRRIELAGLMTIQDFTSEHSPDGTVHIVSMSLDKSDYRGMQAIVERIGYDLPDGHSSEEILAQYYQLGDPPAGLVNLSPCPDAVVQGNTAIPGYNRERKKMLVRIAAFDPAICQELVQTIRGAYDQSLTDHLGGEWYAGRQPEQDKQEAFAYVKGQRDLLDKHMSIVQRVHQTESDRDRIMDLLEPHRFNLAAALAHRRQGKEYTTLADAGTVARANSESFDGDCPSATLSSLNTAGQLEALGFMNKLTTIDKCVNCPFCRRTVDAKTLVGKNPRTGKYTLLYKCLRCHEAIDKKTGERIRPQRAQKLGRLAARKATPKRLVGKMFQLL